MPKEKPVEQTKRSGWIPADQRRAYAASTEDPGLYIRIRRIALGGYVWEMFTREGQVISSSSPFAMRADCEEDAKRQNVPIRGSGAGPRVR